MMNRHCLNTRTAVEILSAVGLRRISLLLCLTPLCSLQADEVTEPLYSMIISGPQVNLEVSCDDPCHIDEVELVGKVAMQANKTESAVGSAEDELSFESECYGDCRKDKTQLSVSGPRKLREGVEVTIEERWAHFIFYSVTDTEKGPATRRQHYEFRIDRPLIEVDLDDHKLRLQARVEQDSDIIRRKTLQR